MQRTEAGMAAGIASEIAAGTVAGGQATAFARAQPFASSSRITPERLGSAAFRAAHGTRYACYAGSMYKGISSPRMVIALGEAGLLGFFGTGGLRGQQVEEGLREISGRLAPDQPYGVNLLCNFGHPEQEEQLVDLLLRWRVPRIEASAYMEVMPSIVRYRLIGARRLADGRIAANRVIAKVSRPEVAAQFMQPAPDAIVQRLLAAGRITAAEAELAPAMPVAEDICVEADSGGHTDRGVASAIVPAIQALRQQVMARHGFAEPIRVGCAGGLGTPGAFAAAFVMGADFVATGSVNQCTVESGASALVKDMLQDMNVQDTAYAPAGDMFELGSRIQVLRKGVFFPARANKLYELYQRHDSLDELDEKTRHQIQEKYFQRSFDEVWDETREFYERLAPREIEKALASPKHRMALVFKWYFVHTTRLAIAGTAEHKVNFQVHCGPALGAFNQWVKGTPLERWENRRVADIAELLMRETAEALNRQFAGWMGEPFQA
jgi:trans-AT polyketide synthase/acyltransferase/oxidoreductase domain-containing protein